MTKPSKVLIIGQAAPLALPCLVHHATGAHDLAQEEGGLGKLLGGVADG